MHHENHGHSSIGTAMPSGNACPLRRAMSLDFHLEIFGKSVQPPNIGLRSTHKKQSACYKPRLAHWPGNCRILGQVIARLHFRVASYMV
jgi:hypothetical protein